MQARNDRDIRRVAKAPHLANRLTDRQKQDAWKLLRIYYSFITNI
jgi:hypothetical protein